MVKKMKSKQEKIDFIIEQLEILVDLKYKINKETDYCNHTYVVKTLLPEYKTSKKLFSDTLKELLD